MVSTAQTALAALFSLLVFSAIFTVQQRNTVVGQVRRAASSLSGWDRGSSVALAPDTFPVSSDPSITAALREMRQQEGVALTRVRASFERKRQELLASSAGPAPTAASSLSVSVASAPDSVAVATFAAARDATIAAAQSEMTATTRHVIPAAAPPQSPPAAVAAVTPAATPLPAVAAVKAAVGRGAAAADGCNRDHSKPLEKDDVLCRVPKGAMAFISLANGAYSEMATNWALLLLPLLQRHGHGDRAFLMALDEAAIDSFVQKRFPVVRTKTKAKHNPTRGGSDGFRWEPGAFRDYGVTKAEAILWLLRADRHVCISDVDTAWIQPPYALFDSLPEADVLGGTDCLHVPFDADRSVRTTDKVEKNCGHQQGSRRSAWFNTGVMLFRATPRAIDMAAEWRERMDAVKGDAQIDDQLTFNQQVGTVWYNGPMVKQSGDRFRTFYPIKAASTNGRVVYAGNNTQKVSFLPADVICSAHIYHVQQSAAAKNCIVLHLTYVEGWPKNPAKHWRLREAGLMPVMPEPFDQKYLSFDPPAPGPAPAERDPSLPPGREMPGKTTDGKGWPVSTALKWSPRLGAHLSLIDRHIAALRNAIAIARVLKRQLVLPKMMCLCERSEGPAALLPQCVLDGASTPIPHVCPLESVFDVARMERLWPYVQLRPWTLLNASIHPPPPGAVPFEAARDVTTVRWTDAGAGQAQNRSAAVGGAGKTVWLPRGVSDVQLREGLEAAGQSDARVLHLEEAEAAFGGFEVEAEGAEFQKQIATHLLGGFSATWCCTSWDKPRGTITFKRPLPLATGANARAGVQRKPEVPAKRQCYWRDCDENGNQK